MNNSQTNLTSGSANLKYFSHNRGNHLAGHQLLEVLVLTHQGEVLVHTSHVAVRHLQLVQVRDVFVQHACECSVRV